MHAFALLKSLHQLVLFLNRSRQVSFAWSGFNNAMISNVGMVLRNIYSKKFLGQLKLDGINLFAILSIISIFYCLPCALVVEGEWLRQCVCAYHKAFPAACDERHANAKAEQGSRTRAKCCFANRHRICTEGWFQAGLTVCSQTAHCPAAGFKGGVNQWAPMWDAGERRCRLCLACMLTCNALRQGTAPVA
jgi:hypothetical protein